MGEPLVNMSKYNPELHLAPLSPRSPVPIVRSWVLATRYLGCIWESAQNQSILVSFQFLKIIWALSSMHQLSSRQLHAAAIPIMLQCSHYFIDFKSSCSVLQNGVRLPVCCNTRSFSVVRSSGDASWSVVTTTWVMSFLFRWNLPLWKGRNLTLKKEKPSPSGMQLLDPIRIRLYNPKDSLMRQWEQAVRKIVTAFHCACAVKCYPFCTLTIIASKYILM